MRAIASISLLLLIVTASCEVLFRRGWYRTHKKGPKLVLTNVTVIDNKIVTNPEYLRISAGIHTLTAGSIRDLNKVTILKFQFCAIVDIDPGAFLNLPKLSALGLMDNEIKHISTGVFNRLSVSMLYLQRNQIETIESQAFDDMPKLYKLKLNSNKISRWDNSWFKNSPRLTEILFRRNDIHEIPSNAFKNIKGSHAYKGAYIVDTKIYLSKNNISYIAADALNGLEEVSQLWFDRNRLSELDARVFSHVTQIGALFLSKNKLRSLPNNMFPKLSSDIDIFDLAGNNNLTCLSYNIVSRIKMTNILDIRKLDCKCIGELMNRLVSEKKINEIKTDCQSEDR